MTIDAPSGGHIPQLRKLWQEAFGDTDVFLDAFWETAFSPARCRCVLEEGKVTAALYWFDCSCRGQKLAYLYAVATACSHRGKGLCAALMENTHAYLKAQGYSGAVLVPAGERLFRYYEKFGYRTCCSANSLTCEAGERELPLRSLSAEEYASCRRKMLPEGAVIQEQENLTFLVTQARFYAAENLLIAATVQDHTVYAMEFLGDAAQCPFVVRTLGGARGQFRMPGSEVPFAMYLPFDDAAPPTWFGLAFD